MSSFEDNHDLVWLKSPWLRIRAWITVVVVLVVVGTAFNAGFSLWQIDQSNRNWCSTIKLLTSQPVKQPSNPTANPSREGQYQLYEDFVQLRANFHCG